MAEFTLRPVPEEKIPDIARERMRTHVYVNINVTDRNPDDHGYRTIGYRTFTDRETWYGASDIERTAAIAQAIKHVAERSGKPIIVEEQ